MLVRAKCDLYANRAWRAKDEVFDSGEAPLPDPNLEPVPEGTPPPQPVQRQEGAPRRAQTMPGQMAR